MKQILLGSMIVNLAILQFDVPYLHIKMLSLEIHGGYEGYNIAENN